MTRLRGCARRGERLIKKTPDACWKTTTLIVSLDHRGVRCATTVNGAANADVFVSFTRQVLVPSLRPGETVIMDNHSLLKVVAAREAIEHAGARLLYLLRYPAALNPIEHACSKIKQWLGSIDHRFVDNLR
ncbi:MAG: transposase [Planctomycetota bacterium]